MKKISILVAIVMLFCMMAPAYAADANQSLIPPKGLEKKVADAKTENPDTYGWIYVPGTKIDGPVMKGEDNQFYFNHNFNKEETTDVSELCYMADRRNEGVPGKLPKNTVIYGPSDTDNPNGDKFAQLRRYEDTKFAYTNPYIYYSDGEKTYTFLVFAVYQTHYNMPYNVPTNDAETLNEVIKFAKENSVRDYSAYQPGEKAKLLTLSTSVFEVDPSETYYPADQYRFVVMAKAVVNPNEQAS